MMRESKEVQRVKLHRRERIDRVERVRRHIDKLAMLRAILHECEVKELHDKARELKPRIRTLEQQLRYMRADDLLSSRAASEEIEP